MLKNKRDTRNDDILLWFYVEKYCREHDMVAPSVSTVSRARRKIQNQEGFYPPNKETQERRKRKQEAYEEAYSNLGVANV